MSFRGHHTMKVLVPSGKGQVDFAQRDIPQPDKDEVLIRVTHFSVNRGETFRLANIDKNWLGKSAENWRPGKDIAGEIVIPEPTGVGPVRGARVVAHLSDSGWAEYAIANLSQLVELPPQVDTALVAALPLAGLTALRLLRATGSVSSQKVLINGSSGGVGHYFVELAAAQGADITAIVGSEDRGKSLLQLGAQSIVTSVPNAGKYDIALDSVGEKQTAQLLHSLKNDGTLVWFGQASLKPVEIDFFDYSGGISAVIKKFYYLDPLYADPRDLTTLVRLVATDKLHPVIGRIENWTEINTVIADLTQRKIIGNAILAVN